MTERRFQGHVLSRWITAVKCAQCSHDHFSGQHRGQQADADLPVEAQRLNDWFDKLPQLSNDAVSQLWERTAVRRNVTKQPEHQCDREDYRPRLFNKNLRPIQQSQA